MLSLGALQLLDQPPCPLHIQSEVSESEVSGTYRRVEAALSRRGKPSNRSLARKPRHAVAVTIVAGQMGQGVCLHDGDNQRIPGQEFVLTAETRTGQHQ